MRTFTANTRGLSLIELLMASALAAGIPILMYALIYQGFEVSKTSAGISLQINSVRNEILAALSNPSSFRQTIRDPANGILCLQAKYANAEPVEVACNNVNGVFKKIYGLQGELLLDHSNPNPLIAATVGFGRDGLPCLGFSTVTDSLCAFRYDFTWKLDCDSYPCSTPQVNINGVLSITPSAVDGVGRRDSYNIQMVIPTAEGLKASCEALGGLGTFNDHGTASTTDDTCDLKMTDPALQCPTAAEPLKRFLVGFQNDGTPICLIDVNYSGTGGTMGIAILIFCGYWIIEDCFPDR